jgi:hypothetical protein
MAMTDLTDTAEELDDAARAQLVTLVVRGMTRGEVTPAIETLIDAGLAAVKGPLVMPVGAAAERAGALLRLPPGSDDESRVHALYEVFLPLNRSLRDLCTSWQCRPDGTPNDHSDAVYDASVRERLDDIHDAAAPMLDRLALCCPRLSGYRAQLETALERLDEGEASWLASPLIDSYHTVWMHLHQELLLALGISRAEDEALEEQLVGGTAR